MSDARSWYFECSGPILLDRSAGASHLDTDRAPWGRLQAVPKPTKGRNTRGAYCLRALMPSHTASAGEIMQVLWSDYYGAVIFGDRREIACIPHKGCRLEIVPTAKTTDPLVNLLLPGHLIRYKRAFFFRDQFELPSNATVGLDERSSASSCSSPRAPLRCDRRRSLSSSWQRHDKERAAAQGTRGPDSACQHSASLVLGTALRDLDPEVHSVASLCCGHTAVQLLSSVGETWS